MNRGDFRLWQDTTKIPDRRDYNNQNGMVFHVFSDDVIDTEQPDRDYCYYWLFEDKSGASMELDRILDKGYIKLIPEEGGGKFKVRRWRRDQAGVYCGGHTLYVIPAETWQAFDEEEKRRFRIGDEIEKSDAAVHAAAEANGGAFGTYVSENGKVREVVKPKRSK